MALFLTSHVFHAAGAQSTATLRSINSGRSAFSGENGGSRVASYTTTSEIDGVKITQFPSEMASIGSTPVYKDKSHEQFRSQNYQLGDQGVVDLCILVCMFVAVPMRL